MKLYFEGKPLFVEGDDRLTSEQYQHIEFRLDGPYIKPCGSKGEFRAYIEVNLLCNSTRNEQNVYDRENLQGILLQALNRDFCIYKIGNVGKEDADDSSMFETMKLIPHDEIKLSDFGRVDTNTEIYMAVAEAHYEMYYFE